MAHSYAEAYALACASILENTQQRLGRNLTAQERRSLWNSGSLMLLESVEQGLMAAPSPAEIEQRLREMEGWTEERFQAALTKLLKLLPGWLGRPVTEAEQAALGQCEHLGVFMNLAERLPQAPSEQRERLLRAATGMDAGADTLPPAEGAAGS
jgi:hypothetical protein